MVGRIGRAAALIAALTVASRIAGFARTVVFARTVGDNDLGDVYVLANTMPNIIFEIVVGGAAVAMVIPLLAPAVAADDRAAAGRVASALLTWISAVLVPLALVVVLGAPVIVGAFTGAGASQAELDTAAHLLRIFAVQVPVYGVGVVLTGVLQAHRRFAWPALAPLLSSLTMIGVYLLFVTVDGARQGLAAASPEGIAILGYGTTLGVVVLSGCLILPVRRLGVRLRPRWELENPAAVRGLALAGAVTVLAQQVCLLVALRLALHGPVGTAVRFNLAQTVYLLPWAVLAVPVAVAAYPSLAQAYVTRDEGGYRDVLARTSRSVVLLSCLGEALLLGVAGPVAGFLVDRGGAAPLAAGIMALAPGLAGYGLAAVLSRALYARHRQRAAAVAMLVGWGVAALAMAGLARVLPVDDRLVAIGAGMSLGMLVLAGVLIGRSGAVAGLWRAIAAGQLAAVAGGAAGIAVVLGLAGGAGRAGTLSEAVTGGLPSAWPPVVLVAVAASVAVVVAYTAAAALLGGGELRTVASGALHRVRALRGRR